MSNIQARNLMLGDYFKCTDPTPFRITEITEEYVYGNDGFKVDVGDLQPIPLTQEILEKNGLKYENYNNETSNDEEYFVCDEFDIHIDNEDLEIRSIDSMNIQLHYVHELQHFMKILNIEKQIKL